MKQLNKRLNMMTTLASLLTLRGEDLAKGTWSWPRQDFDNPLEKNPNPRLELNRQRSKMWPQFSVHGNNTDINLKIHCGQLIVGEVKLFDPRSDCEPDNFNILPSGEDADLIHDDPTWPQAIQQIHHKDLKNPIDFWAALDIVYMMAMQGFKIRAWGYNDRCVFANGALLPDSSDRYGRFRFHMDVTTRQWRNSDLIAPAFDIEGIDTSVPAPKLEDDETLHMGTVVKKDWASIDIYTPGPNDVIPVGNHLTYMTLLDEDGNPMVRDKFYEQMTVQRDGLKYSENALANMSPDKIVEQLREIQVKVLGLPPALVTAGPEHFSIRTHTTLNERFGIGAKPMVLTDRHLNSGREIASVAELMELAEAAIAKAPVPMLVAGDFADGSGVKVMLGDRELTQAELTQLSNEIPEDDTDDGDQTPIDYAVLSDSDRFVRQSPTWPGACEEIPLPDPLTVGMILTEPAALPHIPIVKDGVPVVGATVKPLRKRLYADADRPGISMEFLRGESTIDHGTDYPHLRHLNRQQLEAYLAKETGVYKDTGISVTRSNGGAGWTDPKVDAAFDVHKKLVVSGMRERLLDHGAIEGKVVTVDKRDAAGNVIGHEEIPGDHVLMEDPVHDVPTTDLDLEADPANWDGFLDDDSAGSPRSEDGDTSK